MKRLFEVVKLLSKGRAPSTGAFFESKPEAKRFRDDMNGGVLPDNDKGYRVVHGPDHWRRQGVL